MKVHKEFIAEEIGSALDIQTNLHKDTASELWFNKSHLKVEQKQSNWNTPNTGFKTHPPQSAVRHAKECRLT